MTPLQPVDPDFETRVRRSFEAQEAMRLVGARLTTIEPGIAEIEFAHRTELTQQHGFIHAGILATVLDSACGFAAFSLMPAGASIVSVEFKINLLAPALGARYRAQAQVKRHGRTITVCNADAFAEQETGHLLVATMQGTMMCLEGRTGISG
jgi:uncharacterized protein (TIGR00369 family)